MGVGCRHCSPSHLSMAKFFASVLALACASQAAPQFTGDSSLARILQEQRFNAGGGKFGSAFAQEDGVVFREESSGNNNRIGQYTWVGDDGKTYTTKYSAGPDGFRILSGDHIPSGGQNSAAAELDVNGEIKEYEYEYYEDVQPESPFVSPYDSSHQQQFLKAGDLPGQEPLVPDQHRFFPPGQIKLDRFPEGFNFNF